MSRRYLVAAAAMLALFVGLTLSLASPALRAFDSSAFLVANALRTDWLDITALDITSLGSYALVVIQLLIGVAVLAVRREGIAAAQLVTASAGATVFSRLVKEIVERPRPSDTAPLIEVHGFSYPSGHAVSVAALYLTMALVAREFLRGRGDRIVVSVLAGLLIAIVAASRIYLGVHFASDAVAGVALGSAWALAVASAFVRIADATRTEPLRKRI